MVYNKDKRTRNLVIIQCQHLIGWEIGYILQS